MVRITDLVSRLQRGHHEPEKIKFQTPRKISSTLPGSWMVSGHCGMILGQGGVVWVTLSEQEDSCDLFESCAVDSDQACIGTLQEDICRFRPKFVHF